jgi:hypothetical protein
VEEDEQLTVKLITNDAAKVKKNTIMKTPPPLSPEKNNNNKRIRVHF